MPVSVSIFGQYGKREDKRTEGRHQLFYLKEYQSIYLEELLLNLIKIRIMLIL